MVTITQMLLKDPNLKRFMGSRKKSNGIVKVIESAKIKA